MIIIILLSLLLNCSPAKAENDFWGFIDSALFIEYPEEANKVIKVHKVANPLNQNKGDRREKLELEKDLEDLSVEIKEAMTSVGFNKFSVGTGMVDVTFQVRDGVRYALEDTFTGYAEFQRRKVLEEVLNANARANSITTGFLLLSTGLQEESLGLFQFQDYISIFETFFAFPDFTTFSSNPMWRDSRGHDMLQVSKNIISKPLIKDLNKGIANIAAILLILIFGSQVIVRSGSPHASFSHSISEPIIKMLIALTMILASYFLLSTLFNASYFINSGLHQIIGESGINLAGVIDLEKLNASWESLANNVGYAPTLALSIASIAAQIFAYIYIAGLLMQVIFGFIAAPIWGLAYGSESLEAAAIGSFLNWLKALLTLNFIPVIYLCFTLINNELSNLYIDMLNISFSISALILLPMVSKLIIGERSSVTRSVFWGYELLLSSVESAYGQIRRLLEEQYQLQLNTSHKMLAAREIEPYSLQELIPNNNLAKLEESSLK